MLIESVQRGKGLCLVLIVLTLCMLASNNKELMAPTKITVQACLPPYVPPPHYTGVSNAMNGKFSTFLLYQDQYYIVMLKGTSDSIPPPGKHIRIPILGDDVYEIARDYGWYVPFMARNDRLINYVGDNFIAAPIRLSGGDPVAPHAVEKMKNLVGKKIKGTWQLVSPEERSKVSKFFKANCPYMNTMEARPYNLENRTMPLSVLKFDKPDHSNPVVEG